MIARVISITPQGYEGAIIEVEADAKVGLPGMTIVGMGNKAITEAKERVRSAITSSLLQVPARKLVINLAPAELPKDGTSLDVAIALSLLVVSGQLKQHEVDGAAFVGELALDGSLRPARGALHSVETAHRHGYRPIFVPKANESQCRLIPHAEVIGVESLQELYLHLKQQRLISPATYATPKPPQAAAPVSLFERFHGQPNAVRAAVIACAGHHNLLLSGPPGVGKSLLAQEMRSLLPPLTPDEQLSVTKIHSIAELTQGEVVSERPFRHPHHSISTAALIGGGHRLHPGEISLAHLGILLLDELPEFPRHHIDALRQPLEDREIMISRTHHRTTYPADTMVVATMNPCPCGYYGDPVKACVCRQQQILSYRQRISGPVLDRIDLHVSLPRPQDESIFDSKTLHKNQQSKVLRQIIKARERQIERYKRNNIYNGNSMLSELLETALLEPAAQARLNAAHHRLHLSLRGVGKVLRVARTIADLAQSDHVTTEHVAEALQFR